MDGLRTQSVYAVYQASCGFGLSRWVFRKKAVLACWGRITDARASENGTRSAVTINLLPHLAEDTLMNGAGSWSASGLLKPVASKFPARSHISCA